MTPIELEGLAKILQERGQAGRHLTAIAGAPGAGKSTIADRLAETLGDAAAVVPMDGYHFDDVILNARGWRPRKGAPHTFDVAGFRHLVTRLRDASQGDIAIPVFDRSMELSRNAARIISRDIRHVVIEGNYLMLNETPWDSLFDLFDTTVFLDVPMDELSRRLGARWSKLVGEELRYKLEENDLPNAETVIANSRSAEFVIRNS